MGFYQYIKESTSAGSLDKIEGEYFKFSEFYDPRLGYGSQDFLKDIKNLIDKSDEERSKDIKEIIGFYTGSEDLETILTISKSNVVKIMRALENYIESENYIEMEFLPDGSLLFLEGKRIPDGKMCDFYINSKGDIINVVGHTGEGRFIERFIKVDEFNTDEWGFNEAEILRMEKAKKCILSNLPESNKLVL